MLAVRKLKDQLAEEQNGGDSAVLRALELIEAIYRLRALPPEAGIKPLALRTNANLAKLRHNT